MWLFLLMVFLWGCKWLADKSNEAKWSTLYSLARQDTRNGVREYVYIWHFFWDEIVPEVYTEAKKMKVSVEINPQAHPKKRGPISERSNCDDNFYLIGEKLYGRNPYDQATYKARLLLRNEGYNAYSGAFLFGVSCGPKETSFDVERQFIEYWNRPVEEQCYAPYYRMGLKWMLSEEEEQWYLSQCQHKEWIPPESKRYGYFSLFYNKAEDRMVELRESLKSEKRRDMLGCHI